MNECLQDKQVVTRKDHVCIGCMENIPTGSPAHYQAGTYEGEFYSNYFCTLCDDYLDSLEHRDQLEIWEYGFTGGDIGEWRREAALELARSDPEATAIPSPIGAAAE